jgi:hypothetical protein
MKPPWLGAEGLSSPGLARLPGEPARASAPSVTMVANPGIANDLRI